jgi:predicted RNA-binding Zn-ribbon protein involved in translation (DUF1610 family)
VRNVAGIPPKCLECGTNLRFDAGKIIYYCPACAPEKAEMEEVRESRKEAA